jgi:hypothetical protein
MARIRIRKSVLGAGALLVIAAAATAGTTTAADAPPATAVSAVTSAPTTTSEPTTTTAPRTTTTTTPPITTTTHPTVTAQSLPVVYTCEGHALVRPSTLTVACADAGMVLVDLHWSDWGAATPHATGTFLEKTCKPDCADGGFASYRASVTISELAHGSYGQIRIIAPPAPNQPYNLGLTKP